ncbi:MAG: LysR family transcriptional regulator [Neisseria sp.]|nr:LysR family transcriptional regulator [Neisseria sp.]
MDIRVLNYFLVVAQEENITKAAEILHTTQPNVSRQLAELEERLGKKLFDRSRRKMTLTEEGLFLQKRAKEIVALVNRTENELTAFDQEAGGTVHIGAAETHTMRLLGDVMMALRQSHPQIGFDLFSGSTAEVTEQLGKGLLDFGVLVAPVDLGKYDYLTLPIKDTFGILTHCDSPLAKLAAVTPADLRHQPVLVAKQQLESNIFSGWLGGDIQHLNVVGTFNLITTPAMLVESGLGSAFTFDKLVNTEGRNLCFRPLEPKVETALHLVWKKHQILPKPAKVFLARVKAMWAAEH